MSVEVFRGQAISIIVSLRPHQATAGHFYHAQVLMAYILARSP